MAIINGLNASNYLQNLYQTTSSGASSAASSTAAGSPTTAFADVLNQALTSVSSAEETAGAEGLSLLTGNSSEIHNVVLAAEKADIALQLTVQIRNKVLDAYNEIMRMQI